VGVPGELHHCGGRQLIFSARNAYATTIGVNRYAHLADDPKTASALSLDLASKIVTVLDCGIEDLLELIDRS
jgi:hypothetical protein